MDRTFRKVTNPTIFWSSSSSVDDNVITDIEGDGVLLTFILFAVL